MTNYRPIRPARIAPSDRPILIWVGNAWAIAEGPEIVSAGVEYWADLPHPPPPEAKKMGHARTCECGVCKTCYNREYMRVYRKDNKGKNDRTELYAELGNAGTQ